MLYSKQRKVGASWYSIMTPASGGVGLAGGRNPAGPSGDLCSDYLVWFMPYVELTPADEPDAVGNKAMRHVTYKDAQNPQVSIPTTCMTAGQAAFHQAIKDAMC